MQPADLLIPLRPLDQPPRLPDTRYKTQHEADDHASWRDRQQVFHPSTQEKTNDRTTHQNHRDRDKDPQLPQDLIAVIGGMNHNGGIVATDPCGVNAINRFLSSSQKTSRDHPRACDFRHLTFDLTSLATCTQAMSVVMGQMSKVAL